MEEKYDVLELAVEILEAETEQELEKVLEKCVKILPAFESKEEKKHFFQSAILEIVSKYSTVLTGKPSKTKKDMIIIPL